jgi:hypothetical protein
MGIGPGNDFFVDMNLVLLFGCSFSTADGLYKRHQGCAKPRQRLSALSAVDFILPSFKVANCLL